ncbi:CPBP family intramembrane glutamic endopeptidase [uncultured Polaribacter sp.]|uniref:CPBP family intramembrane glutamic endopeptidase n=1 Tax=uncultured Polaribacter sp. TaxID=174711 RepID=UPI0026265C89|nr:CPBP family intramembrane glutamic endopeptidase [uncultured Polaribacter sp.]
MKETFKNLVNYLKNPVLEEDSNTDINYRLKIFGHLLIICLVTGLAISPLFSLLEYLNFIDMSTHKVEEMFANMSKTQVLLLGAVLTPLIEEAIFRAPLTLFKNKRNFKSAFYIFAILFGFVHIFNFEITTNVIILSPLLVLPQILLGGYLGYIRIRFGLIWAIALHGAYNGILILMSFLG